MEQNNFLEQLRERDPSWVIAQGLVDKHLHIGSHLWSFFRACWAGHLTDRDFIKMLGFTRLNPLCLISAANLNGEAADPDISLVEQAINTIGPKFSCIVLAVRHCANFLTHNHPSLKWKRHLQSLIDHIEIGYRFGMKAASMGKEGGALMGFATSIPILILNAENQEAIGNILSANSIAEASELELSTFGCQRHQIGAFILQKLGFGTNAALGVALALGRFHTRSSNPDDAALPWKAALLWTEALQGGRNYPAEQEMRVFFPQLIPQIESQQKNATLESLYAEISKIRTLGSNWKWHLPKEFN